MKRFIRDKPYYFCVIIDLFSRKVISYSIQNRQETSIILSTFENAFQVRDYPENLTFHSDQGGQYTSQAFKKYLRYRRINQSFSNPGCPYDNAVAESFFRTIKAEEIHRQFYQTADDLYASIDEYIEFFNYKRPHQKLGYRTPAQVEEVYFSA